MPRHPFGLSPQGEAFPPPDQFTAADVFRIGLGLLMIPLGVIILVRTLSIAVTVPGVLIGGAFVAFGVHRLWMAWSRYRLYRQNKNKRGRARWPQH